MTIPHSLLPVRCFESMVPLWTRAIILSAILSIASHAQNLNDSVASRVVSPGIVHTTAMLEGPHVVNLLSIDLRNSRLRLESFRPESLTRTTGQVRMREARGAKVIAAINADFFSFRTHWPLGHQVVGGSLVHASNSYRRSHIGWSDNGIILDTLRFAGTARDRKGHAFAITSVNGARDSGHIVLYTSWWGTSTRTDSGGKEWIIRSPSNWKIGAQNATVIQSIQSRGNSRIDSNAAVISFSQYSRAPEPSVGDTIIVSLEFSVPVIGVRELIGGSGRILLDGQDHSESLSLAEGLNRRFLTDRHPRTFVGIDKETTTVFLAVVDGRQPTSIGMNFNEMARYLQSVGVWNAINLDGGGSTTMVVEGKVVNSPSDRAGERAVANTIMVIEEATPE